jgi:hypothetical protein
MTEYRGSDIIAEYLIREKVPYLLGYAGHGAMGFLDGIYDRTDEIQIVWPRIEQAAGFMADVYFRLTGKSLPVYVSTGPAPPAQPSDRLHPGSGAGTGPLGGYDRRSLCRGSRLEDTDRCDGCGAGHLGQPLPERTHRALRSILAAPVPGTNDTGQAVRAAPLRGRDPQPEHGMTVNRAHEQADIPRRQREERRRCKYGRRRRRVTTQRG